MVLRANTFEGGTPAAGITTGNSGGGSGDAFPYVATNGGSTIVYDTTHVMHGSIAAKITPVASNTTSVQFGSASVPIGSSAMAARAYFYLTALPADPTGIMFFNNASDGRIASVHLDATGKLYVRDTGGTALWTSTNAVPVNDWVRVEFYCKIGNAGTGEIHVAAFLGDSGTAISGATYDNTTTAAMGVATYASAAFGKLSNTPYATAFWLDSLAVETAAAGFIGAPVTAKTTPVYPTSVVSNPGSWANVGGAPSIQAALADGSDTTYMVNPGSSAGEKITIRHAPISDGTIDAIPRVMFETGTTSGTLRMTFKQGATTIATRDVTPTGSWSTPDVAQLTTEEMALLDASGVIDIEYQVL